MSSSPPPKVVLDLRETSQYQQGHVDGAFSFPWSTVERFCAALPPRYVDLHLITEASGDVATEMRRYFTQSGYTRLTFVSPSETACTSLESPDGFCWQPNPFLERHLPFLTPGLALDVGAGAGRDLVFLASRGWVATGFDNRIHLADRCRDFVAHYTCGHRASVCVVDARRPLPFRRSFFDLVHVCRFIHRPLIPALAALLRPGGVLVYSHFLEGCEKSARGYPKNDSGFFRDGELEQLLVAEGLTLRIVEKHRLDDGRPMIHVLAEKV